MVSYGMPIRTCWHGPSCPRRRCGKCMYRHPEDEHFEPLPKLNKCDDGELVRLRRLVATLRTSCAHILAKDAPEARAVPMPKRLKLGTTTSSPSAAPPTADAQHLTSYNVATSNQFDALSLDVDASIDEVAYAESDEDCCCGPLCPSTTRSPRQGARSPHAQVRRAARLLPQRAARAGPTSARGQVR